MPYVRLTIALVALNVGAAKCASAQSFHPIEIPPLPFSLSSPVASVLDVSPDGSRVAGAIIQHGVDIDCAGLKCTTPFTWSATGGMDIEGFQESVQLYETQYGPYLEHAEEIVGVTRDFALANGSQAEPILFNSNGHRLLREVNGERSAMIATALSADASVIVGLTLETDGWQAFRWNESTGVTPIVTGHRSAYATGVSNDGRVVVGTSSESIYFAGNRAFRWSESDGVTYLESLHPNGGNLPTAISADGLVVVGTAWSEEGYRAYRWTAEDGTVPVEIPAEFSASAAADVSADGQVLVGQLVVDEGFGFSGFMGWADPTINYQDAAPAITAKQSHAMIWDAVNGTRLLRDALANDYGLADQLEGWSLVSASAMSANGHVIAGVGVNPAGEFQGWVVIIPEPNAIVLALCGLTLLALFSPAVWKDRCRYTRKVPATSASAQSGPPDQSD